MSAGGDPHWPIFSQPFPAHSSALFHQFVRQLQVIFEVTDDLDPWRTQGRNRSASASAWAAISVMSRRMAAVRPANPCVALGRAPDNRALAMRTGIPALAHRRSTLGHNSVSMMMAIRGRVLAQKSRHCIGQVIRCIDVLNTARPAPPAPGGNRSGWWSSPAVAVRGTIQQCADQRQGGAGFTDRDRVNP
jgi:hypothetical protein